MERMMEDSILDRVRGVNMRLRELLGRTRDALAGRRNFTVEDVRAIAEPVAQMEPIVAEAKRLRTMRPELDGELEAYAGSLGELQVALQQTRVMLIARLANMEALRGHLETVGLWTAALNQTR
jgi:hypothetical protein